VTEPAVDLREITDANRADVLALRLAPGQDRFVSTVEGSLQEAVDYPQGSPWYRAVYAGDEPVGFVMLSWDATPVPGEIIGPWFLWKLLIDRRYQRQGYGGATVRRIVEIVRDEGATELFTSYSTGEGEPWPFYERLGFVPTGERDAQGEVILRLDLANAG
jgi:diamine N-acetyltransferase